MAFSERFVYHEVSETAALRWPVLTALAGTRRDGYSPSRRDTSALRRRARVRHGHAQHIYPHTPPARRDCTRNEIQWWAFHCITRSCFVLNVSPVNFDAGPSWAGLMPISGAHNETRKLFFWYVRCAYSGDDSVCDSWCFRFWPTNNISNINDLLFWTNGACGVMRPACS